MKSPGDFPMKAPMMQTTIMSRMGQPIAQQTKDPEVKVTGSIMEPSPSPVMMLQLVPTEVLWERVSNLEINSQLVHGCKNPGTLHLLTRQMDNWKVNRLGIEELCWSGRGHVSTDGVLTVFVCLFVFDDPPHGTCEKLPFGIIFISLQAGMSQVRYMPTSLNWESSLFQTKFNVCWDQHHQTIIIMIIWRTGAPFWTNNGIFWQFINNQKKVAVVFHH